MAWKIKGVLLSRELKKYNDAIEAFDRALQINPKDSLTWQNKGHNLKALGRNTDADAAFAKAKELGYQG
jgi:Flp pilus assembly protein TadD